MSKLWVVIPAAGESRRFKEAGYETPKPFLRIKAKDGYETWMISHVVHSIPDLDRVSIIAGVSMGLREKLKSDLIDFKSIYSTTGQAHTVLQLLEDLPEEDSVLVLDCDMILEMKDLKKLIEMLSVYDCTIAVTETFDPNSSRVDQIPFPTVFVEKEPISQFGIVGARGFRSILLLKEALEETLKDCKESGKEPYLSMALNHYPGTKFALLIDSYQDWGTPERIKESGAEIV